MTDKIKWSEWKIHEGGECPVDPDTIVEVAFGFGETKSRAAGEWDWDWEWASIDAPLTYRVQLPTPEPVKTEPFAVAFDAKGRYVAVWQETEDGPKWRNYAMGDAKDGNLPIVRFYDEDGNLTETVDLREVKP